MYAALESFLKQQTTTDATRTGIWPMVSVVVATRGSSPLLARCLAALAAQTYRHREVIVVVNGASKLSGHEMELADRVLRELRAGVSAARNTAVAHARGSIIALLDDDVVVQPRWLEAIVEGFSSPDVGCVTGRIVAEGKGYYTDEVYASAETLRHWTVRPGDPGWLNRVLSPAAGFGCNMAFRAELLNRIEFPEFLGAGSPMGSNDENLMFVYTLLHGYALHHSPDAVVIHTFIEAPQQQRRRRMLYATSLAFHFHLIRMLRGHRQEVLGALLTRLRKGIGRHALLASPEWGRMSVPSKLFAAWLGLRLYWRSRPAAVAYMRDHAGYRLTVNSEARMLTEQNERRCRHT